MENQDQLTCPKCGSHQIHADKKGFSGKKAVAGAVLTGGIGLLAGTIGSNKIKLHCLKCGNVFKIGDTNYNSLRGNHHNRPASKTERKVIKVLSLVLSIAFSLIALIGIICVFSIESNLIWFPIICLLLAFLFFRIYKKQNNTF